MESKSKDDNKKAEHDQVEEEHDEHESDEDDDRRDEPLGTICKLSKLGDLDKLHRRLINLAPSRKMQKLARIKLLAALLESLLTHWVREGGWTFRLSGRLLDFSVDEMRVGCYMSI